MRSIGPALVTVVTLAVALVAAEGATRWIDGYPMRLQLVAPTTTRQKSASGKWVDPAAAAYYVDRLPTAAGVDRRWFGLDPTPRPAIPIDPALDRRYRLHEGFELSSEYEWNREYVRRAVCGDTTYNMAVFAHLSDLFMFDAADSEPYPAFRFLRHTHYPSGLTTNNFGWRGEDVALNKPPATVRIAFVGASTTIDPHAGQFSFPEYIGRWLSEWAHARSDTVRFEIINAGREGVASNSVAGVVVQELVPVRPDLVVFYWGSSQFWPSDIVSGAQPRPAQVATGEPSLYRYSALAIRVRNALNARRAGSEPPKPDLRVNWPAAVDEGAPDVDSPDLPAPLPVTVRDLDRMRTALSAYGGTLVPSSVVWLVYDGMKLDRQRDAGLYAYLNDTFWPFSYRLMRRMIDFENRVYRRYAESRGLPFNDLASTYPADPRLFLDAVHMGPAGIKLKAWLVLQQLVPELDRRLADGRLPVRDPGGRLQHPAFAADAPHLVPLDDLRRHCS